MLRCGDFPSCQSLLKSFFKVFFQSLFFLCRIATTILRTTNIIRHSGSSSDDSPQLPRLNHTISLNKADNPSLRSTYLLKIDRIMINNVCKTSWRNTKVFLGVPSGEIKHLFLAPSFLSLFASLSFKILQGLTNIHPPLLLLLSSKPIGRTHRVQEIETRIISSNHWRRANSSQ